MLIKEMEITAEDPLLPTLIGKSYFCLRCKEHITEDLQEMKAHLETVHQIEVPNELRKELGFHLHDGKKSQSIYNISHSGEVLFQSCVVFQEHPKSFMSFLSDFADFCDRIELKRTNRRAWKALQPMKQKVKVKKKRRM